MTTSTDAPGQIELPVAGSEVDTLLGALDRNRRTFAWKCFGLSAEEMRRTLGPSTMTLAGLVKHVALVEDYYFSLGLGEHMPAPWADVDFDADPDWDWRSAADDSPEELQALWEAAAGRSRAAVAAFLAAGGPDSRVKWTEWTEPPNLRRMLVDMIEEYARHTGHADLIRESVDGLVGEGLPPEDSEQ
jgi:uncharacterized damage-inducible protein DinB